MKNIIATSIEFDELRHDTSTRLSSDIIVANSTKPLVGYRYWATFKHRIKGNRSRWGGWPSRKSSVEFELWIKGRRRGKMSWKNRKEVPPRHRKVWDFMERSAHIIFDQNKYNCLSLWKESQGGTNE